MTAALIEAHRRDLDQLLRMADADLAAVWQQITDAVIARELLQEVLPDLVAVYGSAAATLGADWYEEMREAADAPGRFRATVADLPDRGRTDALARWGVGPLFAAEPDLDAARTLVAGGFQRIVADADRRTVADAAVADPASDGWQRVGTGGSCPFCTMLIARGAVYREATAAFASHDHCNCTAAPVFAGQARPVKPYTPSARNISAADRARVREYLATH